jgi:hypothetical protein
MYLKTLNPGHGHFRVFGRILATLEHLHPAALKGHGKPFDAALEKNLPHPSCHGSSNFRLHSLSSRVSVALAAPTFRGLIHLRFSESCHFWESGALLEIFLTVCKVEVPVCTVMVWWGSATLLKFSACLEPFKAHFESRLSAAGWRCSYELPLELNLWALLPFWNLELNLRSLSARDANIANCED